MINSLCIRLVVPYIKVSRHIRLQNRLLNIKTGSLVSLGQVVDIGRPRPISFCHGPSTENSDPNLYTYNHSISCGLCLCGGQFRLCVGNSSYRHLEIVAKSFRRGLCSSERLEGSTSANHPDNGTIATTYSKSSNSYEPFAQEHIENITNGDAILEKKLKVLFLEVDVWKQEGRKVPNPSFIKDDQWKELLKLNARSGRQKYLLYLWGIEMKKLNKQLKKEVKKKEHDEESKSDPEESDHIQYGLRHNTIFMRIYDTTINQHYNNKLIQAMQFGQKIVVDCGYDANMTSREAENAAKQIMLLFSENRLHIDPYDVYLCNVNHNSRMLNKLQGFIPTMHDDHFPLHVTEKSYLELFPKGDIVYLTPHCREELKHYDHESVYVIGGIVDKVNQEPLSLAKAKREGLRMAKLPLDRYLSWGSGSGKSLTINQMMQILLEIKFSGDWVKALQFVPSRKLICSKPGEQFKEKQIKQYRLKREKFY